jgi:hypothetical protein
MKLYLNTGLGAKKWAADSHRRRLATAFDVEDSATLSTSGRTHGSGIEGADA